MAAAGAGAGKMAAVEAQPGKCGLFYQHSSHPGIFVIFFQNTAVNLVWERSEKNQRFPELY